MSTIWLDVTTTLAWTRPAVGVVRVETECVRAALIPNLTAVEVRFCRFDHARGYEEVPREQIITMLERLSGHQHHPAPAQQSSVTTCAPQRQRLEDRLRIVAMETLRRVPARYQGRVFAFLHSRKAAIHEAIVGARLLKHSSITLVKSLRRRRQLPVTPASSTTPLFNAPFRRGDVYVALGLDWHDKNFVYLNKLKKSVGFKVQLFCYDLIPVRLPQLCAGDVAPFYSKYFVEMAWTADKILCISQSSERDLHSTLEILGAPRPSTEVVTLGSDIVCANDSLPPETTPYILFVSTIDRRKNHEILYRAYTRLVEQGIPDLPQLVFVGMKGWGVDDLLNDLRLDPRIQGLIDMKHSVSDDELNALYKGALFTVYPSLYEGWGIPVAESLGHGKFCLSSNTSSLPEVGGEFVEYLDPTDLPAWQERLLFYIQNPDAVAEKERVLRERYIPFAWQETSSDILQSAQQLAGPQPAAV
jgi:glycosyltransferase involved in cell wall biosynthesis